MTKDDSSHGGSSLFSCLTGRNTPPRGRPNCIGPPSGKEGSFPVFVPPKGGLSQGGAKRPMGLSLSNVYGNNNIKPVPAAAVNQLKRMYCIQQTVDYLVPPWPRPGRPEPPATGQGGPSPQPQAGVSSPARGAGRSCPPGSPRLRGCTLLPILVPPSPLA